MELRAGASSASDRRLVRQVEVPFEKAGRIVVPSQTVFADAGDTLRRLRTARGYQIAANPSIVSDVLTICR
jgi:predicted nucleic acid-binding protein